MMKLSCVDTLVPGRTYREKAQNLRAWGYDGMAVYADSRTWTDQQTEELMRLKPECGVEVAEFCLVGDGYGHLLEDEEAAQRSVQTVCRAVDISAALGAVTEVEFDAPRVTEISYDHHAYPDPPPKLVQRFIRGMRAICAFAKERNMTVLLEACNRYEREYNNTQAQSARLLDAVGCENTMLLCDLFHMSLDERDVAQTLLACGSRVGHVHLGDTNRRLPGQGAMPWDRIFAALREIGYHGYLNLECSVFGDPAAELPKTAAFLRRYL